ncbi:MAG: transposase [Gammaproteobacteria bacterium]|nr:transposase [Gammaproteobacteria bacterium]
MRYRRTDIKGGTYFFTVNLAQRNKTLLVDNVNILRDVMNKVKQRHPFKVEAMVILPDHLHAIWTLPQTDKDYATRWGLIKSGFSRQLPKLERINKSRIDKGERGIWQRRYWEHLIRDERDFNNHVDYIHYNPVKHGYIKRPVDWPYSSIHKFIETGLIDKDWACNKSELIEKKLGEIF